MDSFINEKLNILYDKKLLNFDPDDSLKLRIAKYVYIVNNSIELLNVIIAISAYNVITKKLERVIYEIIDGWIYVINMEDFRNEIQIRNILYLSDALTELLNLTISAKQTYQVYNYREIDHNNLIVEYFKFINENISPLTSDRNLHIFLTNIIASNVNSSNSDSSNTITSNSDSSNTITSNSDSSNTLASNSDSSNVIISGNSNRRDFIKSTIINYRKQNQQNISDLTQLREEIKFITRLFANIFNSVKYEIRYI
jgi:hypothetical protein